MLPEKIIVEQLTDPTFVNGRPTLCSRSNFTGCISLLLNTPAQKRVLPCTEAAVCKAHETQHPQTQLPHAKQYFQHSWQHLHLCWSESSSTVINWVHKNVNFFNKWHSIVFYSLIYQKLFSKPNYILWWKQYQLLQFATCFNLTGHNLIKFIRLCFKHKITTPAMVSQIQLCLMFAWRCIIDINNANNQLDSTITVY